MAFRVGKENGRAGWYVYVDKPLAFRKRKGSNTVRRKAGDTREQALAAALRIEAQLMEKWTREAEKNPFQAARELSQNSSLDLEEALSLELREQGYKTEERARLLLGLENPEEVERQGYEIRLDRTEQAQLNEALSETRPWMEWVRERNLLEDCAKSTVVNWETKLKGLAGWYGSNVVGTMSRKDANAYKLHLVEKGLSPHSVSNYLGTFSGFWNWAINSGELSGENPWKGQKRGLPKPRRRHALNPEKLREAEDKADHLGDIRFWFGRYQGLRKEDYTGLRWLDIDTNRKVIHLQQYEWQGQRRNLKLKERGERTIPIHSKLMERLQTMLPEAFERDDATPIWAEDYKAKLECWGATWAETFKYRYGFGTHDLRRHVVTQMTKSNINPYYLHAITGHRVPGTSDVVQSYVTPTIEEVREVLELLE